ncbi:hypothetical protein GCM10027445_57370 [Amycolatopsis endophytica]|uniref:DUF742 domain-containing protein n=1 Tax=Amycolatopsis endophytica TaxID=860233 RepID=A0A853B2Z3_9PSEU|nr:DUF742 domain-containing protein [Amycolatopsis endophytica]NYI89195.1 hypothetical protein [Amycolatopsis endophytica]
MRGPSKGTGRADAWDRLHQGTDREGLDSPARFKLTKKPVVLQVRTPARPVVPPPDAEPAWPSSAPVETAPRGVPAGARAVPPAQSRGRAASSVRTRMIMRPYARTGGRTRPDYELALEALVSVTERGRAPRAVAGVQHRRICGLCAEPRSIAEIAAYLSLPLNVVKVLVSDLDSAGLVLIHQSGLSFGDRSSREFMDRVLQGLRRL